MTTRGRGDRPWVRADDFLAPAPRRHRRPAVGREQHDAAFARAHEGVVHARAEVVRHANADGRGSLFDAEEMALLLDHAKADPALSAAAYGRKDSTGMETKLALFNRAGDDLYGTITRTPFSSLAGNCGWGSPSFHRADRG